MHNYYFNKSHFHHKISLETKNIVLRIFLAHSYSDLALLKYIKLFSKPANPSLRKKKHLCLKCTSLHWILQRSPTRESIFQYPAYFALLAEIHISISISCIERVIFSVPPFCNSLSGISVRMKRVCTERISVAVRITTDFLLPYCAGTDPLSASSLSLLIPFPLLKKKNPLLRAFPFSHPYTSAVIAYLEL